MIDVVSGYTIRNLDGVLVGFKCPISLKAFYGDDAERQQYEHSLAIMLEQGMYSTPIGERRRMYLESGRR